MTEQKLERVFEDTDGTKVRATVTGEAIPSDEPGTEHRIVFDGRYQAHATLGSDGLAGLSVEELQDLYEEARPERR